MAIIVGGTEINLNTLQQPASQPAPAQQPPPQHQMRHAPSADTPQTTPINPVTYVKATARMSNDPDKHYVVHGGKAKEISKKSRYLLDMLTTE